MSNLEAKRTIYALHLEMEKKRGGDYVPIAYSTLNESLGFHQSESVPAGSYPTDEYLHLGIGGAATRSGGSGLVDDIEHDITDAVLHAPIPLVMRKTDNDLTPTQRENYAGRKLIEKNGVQYFAYYLRKLNAATSTVSLEVVDELLDISSGYQPAASQLNPTKLTVQQASANAASGKKVAVGYKMDFSLSPEEISELVSVINILYDGDMAYGLINEMAIVNGFSKTVTSTVGGVSAQYDEAVAATIQCHTPCSIKLQFTSNGADLTFDVLDILAYLR